MTCGCVLALALGGCGDGPSPRAAPDRRPPLVAVEAGPAIGAGRMPVAVAVGSGSVWVADAAGDALLRFDPERRRRRGAPIPMDAAPFAVAIGEGVVWVAGVADGTVTRVVPGSPRPGRPVRIGGSPLALAADEDAIWVARASGEFGDRIEVVRLDPATRRLAARPVPIEGAVPLDLAAGGGSVWATDAGGPRPLRPARSGRVTRIAAARSAVAGAPIPTGRRPTGVAVGDGVTRVVNAGDGTLTPIGEAR